MGNLTSETLPLSVSNTGFLLDRLGEDCHPLQFLRELTQNAIEAILRTPEQQGDIVWDVDWIPYEIGEHQAPKLCITDNGIGMTGDEMIRYINALSSSASVQSTEGNYGVGAKIAAATRNHSGLIYLSWKQSLGSMIHLWRDPRSGQYGLRQFKRPDGTFDHCADIDDAIKPTLIREHGTKIVLLGNSDDADTMKAPKEAPSPSLWISKYLNTRYFIIPDGVTIRARQGWEQPRDNTDVNLLRTITGQSVYLEKHAESKGEIPLADAIAHWWILRDEPALSQNSGYAESSGHIAALYQNELYEMASGRAGSAKLQQFGVIFGQRRVVIYVEPSASNQRLTTNTARTLLLLDRSSLPWTEWASEFRERMPEEISELMNEIAAAAVSSDHSKSIRERLKSLLELYKVSRYRPSPTGTLRIGEPAPATGGQPAADRNAKSSESAGGSGGGSERSGLVGGIYATFLKRKGQPGEDARPDLFPKVDWISISDNTREPRDLEDKAARYLQDQNHLLINSDFRGFVDMIDHWVQQYRKGHGDTPGIREMIRDSVHDWFEQALVETVIGLQALKGSPEWSRDSINTALSEEALTAVVMQRYHPYNSVKRELGTKIASLKTI
jgi:hypothetical protein